MQLINLVDKKPHGIVLSASQIERYDLCKRRWGLEYIAGIRSPPHPSAQLGTDIHKQLEDWLHTGTPPNKNIKAGQVAARMVRHLPPPGTGTVERKFHFTTRNGIHFTGVIDWSGIFEDWPTTIDHKSTSNLQYAKTEADLHNDPQALLYTLAGCEGFGTDSMQLFWNYGCTKGAVAEVRAVKTRVRLAVVEEKFERIIEPVAAEMVELRTSKPDPMSLPPNPAACGAFGGCPHQNICNLTQNERLHGIMNAQAPTLASRMANFPGANGAAKSASPFAPPQQGGFTPPGAQAPAFTPPAPQAPQAPAFQPPAPPMAQAAPAPAFQPPQGGFAPPQAGFTPPGAQNNAGPAQQQLGFSPETAPNPPENGQAMPPPPADEPKRGRGRPAGAKAKSKDGDTLPAVNMSLYGDETLFAQAMLAMIGSGAFDGTPDMLFQAGEAALIAYKAKFPTEG
jgi:hypothetical protein